jgi:hypothetical protein
MNPPQTKLPKGSKYIGPKELLTPCDSWWCDKRCPGKIDGECVFHGDRVVTRAARYFSGTRSAKYFAMRQVKSDEPSEPKRCIRKYHLG